MNEGPEMDDGSGADGGGGVIVMMMIWLLLLGGVGLVALGWWLRAFFIS